MVKEISEILKFVEKYRFNFIPRERNLKFGGYEFIIITSGSYPDKKTSEIGVITMFITKNGVFALNGVDDNSIIRYMQFKDFKNFCLELSRENVNYEELFLKYKRKEKN